MHVLGPLRRQIASVQMKFVRDGLDAVDKYLYMAIVDLGCNRLNMYQKKVTRRLCPIYLYTVTNVIAPVQGLLNSTNLSRILEA